MAIMKLRAYEFNLPTKIIFGWESLRKLPQIMAQYGDKVLLVTGHNSAKKSGVLTSVQSTLEERKIEIILFSQVEPEPSCDTVNSGVRLAKEKKCDVVIGLGGGSALDVAKAIAAISKTEGLIEEFQAGTRILEKPGLPFIAIPTTAGTGSEVTPNSVLINTQKKIKQSFHDPLMFAKVALVDPELTMAMPPQLTAYSGIDALCQAIESFVSKDANPLTDSIAIHAIKLIKDNLLKAYTDGQDKDARIAMSYAALFSGITLTNARMGAVHGIVHPLGVRYHISHGLLCGLLLPAVMKFNLDIAGSKYAEIAAIFGENITGLNNIEAGKKAIPRIKQLLAKLQFPQNLKIVGVMEKTFLQVAKESMNSASLRANPKRVTEQNVVEILRAAL
jgi:alcohol dehydrogenase class IV